MSARVATRLALAAFVAVLAAAPAPGYIHFPPMTLKKMCEVSHHVRVLKVRKFDKETGVVAFEVAETLKAGDKTVVAAFRHRLQAEEPGAKRVLDWVADGKQAVMFTIESKPGGPGQPIACGYVFIDEFCYSVDYNAEGKYWLFIRGEPGMSACYHGSAEKLPGLVRDVLAGKEVKVPVKEPAEKTDWDRRAKEVEAVLRQNRGGG